MKRTLFKLVTVSALFTVVSMTAGQLANAQQSPVGQIMRGEEIVNASQASDIGQARVFYFESVEVEVPDLLPDQEDTLVKFVSAKKQQFLTVEELETLTSQVRDMLVDKNIKPADISYGISESVFFIRMNDRSSG